ncbi:putative DUF1960-domain-containing protein [Lyophyllum shimeji]|uniref:DUF1960-domain-containing protein n=1 Tax=Lyophyllum shimeji TaxID=47721 RepID=A0A9P3PDP8_LYOSH|nr:putative DUF1960-domain-containing protein [Lyophyllum shimeji]
MPQTKAITKVVYHPDPKTTDEYTLIVNVPEYKKWKAGVRVSDTSLPLVEVVDSFKVYHSNQGHTGLLYTPSQQQLDTHFGTHNENDVVKIVLEKGLVQQSDRIESGTAIFNAARGRGAAQGMTKAGVSDYDQRPLVTRSK